MEKSDRVVRTAQRLARLSGRQWAQFVRRLRQLRRQHLLAVEARRRYAWAEQLWE